MKRINKFLSVFLALIMVITIIPMSAITVGATESAPLKVEVSTDKSSYKATGIAEITVKITNTSDEAVSNISAEVVFDDLAPVKKKKSVTFKEVDNLQPSDSFEFEYKATINADGMKVGFFDKIGLWFVRLFNGGYSASSHNTTALIQEITVIEFGKYSAENVVVVDYDGKEICEEYEELIKDVDIDEVYEHSDEDVSFDEDTETTFINNVVIINFDWDCSNERKAEIVNSINGKVVGGIDGYNELHVKINKSSFEELEVLIEELNKNEDIYAHYDEFTDISFNSAPTNDEWDNRANWEEVNNDYANWWVVATKTHLAWEYEEYFKKINIGIVDDGFKSDHEDVKIQTISEENVEKNHGTHVSGIIGAKHNNGKGIAGVVDKCSLYGYSVGKEEKEELKKDSEIYKGIETLVADYECKIINLSLGKQLKSLKAAKKHGKKTSEKIGRFLEICKETDKDFVIIQAAGNGEKNDDGEPLGIDAVFNGFFASITREECYSSDRIAVDDIMNRVIVVGAAYKTWEKENTYEMTTFSNAGSCVDIVAPGYNIYSTVAGKYQEDEIGNVIVEEGKKYRQLNGTSQAAPIVAGIAGLVWSVDENLSGADVKDIILKSAKAGNVKAYDNPYSPTTGDFYMVNAKLAVEEALRWTYGDLATISGTVTDKNTGDPISDVSVEFIDNEGDSFEPIMTTTTDADGKYFVKLPNGSYSVSFNHSNYDYYGTSIDTIENSNMINASLTLKNGDDNGDDNEGGDDNGGNCDDNGGNSDDNGGNSDDNGGNEEFMTEVVANSNIGDIIEFGSYPQAEVTDSTLISTLNSLVTSWTSYDYYTGTGNWYDGKMAPSDYMKYTDVIYNNTKYRGVYFTAYRPYCTGYISSPSNTYQDDNDYYTNTTYWFKYEPLNWRILDPNEGYVMCESIIDSQAYQNTVYRSESGGYGGSYYQDATRTTLADDYAASSLREWLNDDFYNTAFTSSEKAQIGTTNEYKIFILSNDIRNNEYGFSSRPGYDKAREAQGTDYAKCQGLYVYDGNSIAYQGNSRWWFHSSDDGAYSEFAAGIDYYGSVGAYYDHYVNFTHIGVRPAFKFNPKSLIS